MNSWSGLVRRHLASALYYGLARRLPWSPRPLGSPARRIRGLLAASMLDSCGESVNIERGAYFGSGKGIEVGDRSDLGMDVLVMGPITIGADVMMGPRCVMISSSHATSRTDVAMNTQGFVADRRIVIEDDVWIGAGVTILAGRRIGHGSIVAAGAVVVHDVAPWSIVGGNPAVVIRTRQR